MKTPFWTRLLLYHPASSGFLCSDSGSTVSPHTKPGLLFNEARPQGEKNNYLFRHRGEESLTPLIFPCLYLLLSCWGKISCVFWWFSECALLWASFPLCMERTQMFVTPQAGGQTPWPNYRFPFSFPTYFLALPKRQRSYIISCSQSLQTSYFF